MYRAIRNLIKSNQIYLLKTHHTSMQQVVKQLISRANKAQKSTVTLLDAFKVAYITPLIKKPDLDAEPIHRVQNHPACRGGSTDGVSSSCHHASRHTGRATQLRWPLLKSVLTWSETWTHSASILLQLSAAFDTGALAEVLWHPRLRSAVDSELYWPLV